MTNVWYVKKTPANCDGNLYLPILHLPRAELHCKLQEKFHRVTGPLFSRVPATLFPPLDGKSFFHYILVIRLPPPLLSQVCNRLTKSIGGQSKACFVIEIHKIKIKLPFFNKFEPEPTLYIELSEHTSFDNLNNLRPHSVSIADFMVLLSN